MALTAKQRAFVENYSGNATEAAIKAGYNKDTAYSQGQRLLKNVEIQQAIQQRETKRLNPVIAKRERLMEFWTQTMEDTDVYIKERLRASELLGKAQGVFMERVEVEHSGNLDLTATVRLALLEREKNRRKEAADDGDESSGED